MIKRSQWGAKPLTKYTNTIRAGARSQIVIHHSVTAEGKTQLEVEGILRRIDAQHRANGWGGIGYNLAVDYAGRVYEARGIDIHGAHAAGSNAKGYGICYIGDGRKRITPEAIQAIQRLVIELQARSLKKLQVVGHNQVNRTECPSELIIAEITKGTFDAPYPLPKPPVAPPIDERKYVVVRAGDSYWRIAVRVLGVSNTPKNYPAIIRESNRIQNLNNKAPLVAGQKVRIS
jgi:nucleoid-associated protein YgaU